MTEPNPMSEHAGLTDTFASRRYFAKWQAITAYLARVAGVMEAEKRLTREEVKVLTRQVAALTYTFKALSMKYLMVGRDTGRFFGSLNMDTVESGFPVAAELMTMANDAAQAQTHLAGLPDAGAFKQEMIRKIVGDREVPTKLQFALSQRLYYEELLRGDFFWVHNHPQMEWLSGEGERRRYMVDWAVYDTQLNLPTVYLMEVEDTGRHPLPQDTRRWPEVQAHLMAQAVGALKLLTIAKGFDEDFDDLHPKSLKRIHLGPMYSHEYTRQTGPLREVLEEAKSPPGQDWALAWTIEELESERVETQRAGWFSTVEREVFALDPFSGRGVDTGATRMERAIILPQRPFQVLAEKNPPGFASVRKFVVSPSGSVLSY